ncbi:hypothetical protein [Cellulomonas fengjieae]|uniref:Uncharacterized protein n=1 Tax=Cellulomonas fengjieae TaxID=2819978 RepID=A0ABS3SK85_9CELL|nr:hypothetical protein [Cellulomonas fengjieae]MBO3086155.1 hypothetical protein [Cellulomonas fengjieae]MBO3102441.1 hypothetical protein [Cellulomonas fengjieae]QVI65784.1 hypothetical protein KG102_17185 [Cellulomonas fengjieae]
MADLEQARAAKEHLRTRLKGRSDVRGIGIARSADGYQLQVNMSHEPGPDLPGAVDGVDVRVRVVGTIRASA